MSKETDEADLLARSKKELSELDDLDKFIMKAQDCRLKIPAADEFLHYIARVVKEHEAAHPYKDPPMEGIDAETNSMFKEQYLIIKRFRFRNSLIRDRIVSNSDLVLVQKHKVLKGLMAVEELSGDGS